MKKTVAAVAVMAGVAAAADPQGPGWYMSFYNENCAQACERQTNMVFLPDATHRIDDPQKANQLNTAMFHCEITRTPPRLVNNGASPGWSDGQLWYTNNGASNALGFGKRTNRICCCAWHAPSCPILPAYRPIYTANGQDPHCGKYARDMAGVVPLYPPSGSPTAPPVVAPTNRPTNAPPTNRPTVEPTSRPTGFPTTPPVDVPTNRPTAMPTVPPTTPRPTVAPTTPPPTFLGCRRADTPTQCRNLPASENCDYVRYSDLMQARVRPLQQKRNMAPTQAAKNRLTQRIRDVRAEYASCINGCQNISACGAICEPLCQSDRIKGCRYSEDLQECVAIN